MNLAYISGNAGKDPEVRQTQNGTKVATYTLASYRANPKDKDKPFTDWYNVVAWGDQVDLVVANIKKGTKVLVTGRFNTRNYDDKDGKKVYVTELMQNDFWLAPVKEKKAETHDSGSTFPDSELPF